MAEVYVSIGSNIHRYRHVKASLDALSEIFSSLEISPVYESEAIGFEGDNFLNLVVGFTTLMSVGDLQQALKRIEDDYGRERGGPKFSARTLDIDILTYDEIVGMHDGVLLPRDEILTNAFVLQPLFDISPKRLHPEVKKSYAQLWQEYDRQSQALWAVDFEWRGRDISVAEL